ncbi:type II toxin-antitoxin system MqsA family antitoxin [Geomonas subterranea]|uniref:Type II toxin-antitoxin system MqsA family antitoxin n=1 Tax=Geomonas subterranea TaxID=2847989 RepID=A0ABX8LD70_9BACT|nr:type II toxin-antitoxin system MqsA family antitoxin [Geomonas subterranea]QXE89962.1 type II toxin-antitoxin system MqsA family antitoxin [Geomonas subterranea]QXM07919.1 type II toxin-antitoxin system MqsA family antitoxin [Geomonas subterranea]
MARNYKNGDPCPLCGGVLEAKAETEIFSYKGQNLEYDNYIVHECLTCSEQFVGDKTMKESARRLRDFYREVDGLLTSSQIREIRLRLGLSQDAASELLGGGGKSFARYENCEVVQSLAMDHLLRLLDAKPENLDIIKAKGKQTPQTTIPFKAKFGAVMTGHMVVNYGK